MKRLLFKLWSKFRKWSLRDSPRDLTLFQVRLLSYYVDIGEGATLFDVVKKDRLKSEEDKERYHKGD